jgi:hypothetical protein
VILCGGPECGIKLILWIFNLSFETPPVIFAAVTAAALINDYKGIISRNWSTQPG